MYSNNLLSSPNNQVQTQSALDQARLFQLNKPLKNHENREELKKVSQQFEGIFIQQLLEAMDKTIDRSGFMGGGMGEETFRGLLYQKIGESFATRHGGSGFGLAESIYRQMEKGLPPDSTNQDSTQLMQRQPVEKP